MAIEASGTLTAGAVSRAQIGGALRAAAGSTGTSFQYLLATAKMESNFDPAAKATTSSARGLFQFIDQTWLGTVKEAGAALGYGKYAEAITRNESGTYSVADPAARRDILALRDNPDISAAMAGVLTRSNSAKLTNALGRAPSGAEQYMAHFMGVGGATRLIDAAQTTPGASGAALFPKAASANRAIFYDGNGAARSVAGVYAALNDRYAAAANSASARSVMTSVGETMPAASTAAAAVPAAAGTTMLSRFPEPSQAVVASFASEPARDTEGAMFRTLFQPGARREPVSPAVRALWSNGTSLTSVSTSLTSVSTAASTAGARPEVRAPQPLDLFSDRSGAFSG